MRLFLFLLFGFFTVLATAQGNFEKVYDFGNCQPYYSMSKNGLHFVVVGTLSRRQCFADENPIRFEVHSRTSAGWSVQNYTFDPTPYRKSKQWGPWRDLKISNDGLKLVVIFDNRPYSKAAILDFKTSTSKVHFLSDHEPISKDALWNEDLTIGITSKWQCNFALSCLEYTLFSTEKGGRLDFGSGKPLFLGGDYYLLEHKHADYSYTYSVRKISTNKEVYRGPAGYPWQLKPEKDLFQFFDNDESLHTINLRNGRHETIKKTGLHPFGFIDEKTVFSRRENNTTEIIDLESSNVILTVPWSLQDVSSDLRFGVGYKYISDITGGHKTASSLLDLRSGKELLSKGNLLKSNFYFFNEFADLYWMSTATTKNYGDIYSFKEEAN